MKRLLTTLEVCDLLQLRSTAVNRLRQEGRLVAVKMGDGVGAPVRFRVEDVEAFLDAHREEERCRTGSSGSKQESASDGSGTGRTDGSSDGSTPLAHNDKSGWTTERPFELPGRSGLSVSVMPGGASPRIERP